MALIRISSTVAMNVTYYWATNLQSTDFVGQIFGQKILRALTDSMELAGDNSTAYKAPI
jgi:hypothetical protein